MSPNTPEEMKAESEAHAWKVAKSLQTQVTILRTALETIATQSPDNPQAVAQEALHKLAEHMKS